MPIYEIPAANYDIPVYAGLETPFSRLAEDTLLGPATPVVLDATQTAISYPHYFGTDFDGTYDSLNTPIMQDQQESFRQDMANAAAAGNRGDYGLQAGYIWNAYNPGFAVLAQLGMLPRAIGQVLAAGRAANRYWDGILERWGGDTPDEIMARYEKPTQPRTSNEQRVSFNPDELNLSGKESVDRYADSILEQWGEGISTPTPIPTPAPVPAPTPAPAPAPAPSPVGSYWDDAISEFERIVKSGQPKQPFKPYYVRPLDRWGRPL